MKVMKRVKWSDFKNRSIRDIEITEPTVITADGDDVFVVMSLENYYAMLPVNSNPPRQPRMVRIQGILYREVI